MKTTPTKSRSIEVYNKKVALMTQWHAERLKARESWPEQKLKLKLKKPLHPLEYYLERIKKPVLSK